MAARSLGILVFAVACSSPSKPSVTPPPATPTVTPPAATPPAFAALVQDFLDRSFELGPVSATLMGDHRFDAKWPDLSVEGEARYRAFADDISKRLAAFPRETLDAQQAIDAAILDDVLRYNLFQLDQLKGAEVNPLTYTGLIGEGLDPLITRTFGTPETRYASLVARLDGIPAVLAVAKRRLAHPAKVATETAIEQNTGLISLVETELAGSFDKSHAAELTAAGKRAGAALRDFQQFLEKELLPRSDGSFRLGRERFKIKLGFELSDDVDPDAIAAGAHALLTETQAAMVDTAKQIWTADKRGALPKLDTPEQKKAFVKQVLDHVAKDRPTNTTIVADAKRWLDQATAFVREHDLVRVPDEPVAVIEMPEYRRGVAVAYCESSGALEAKPETFYAISPTPKAWPKARVDSFYREYNSAMLAELSIHEAMPGHYLQGMHNNKFPSKLRAVFASGPFVEGWAVYGEWLMAEHGFGGPRVKLQRQKMVLRVAANAILDHDIHAGTMEEKDALDLMKNEALQEDGEAVGKWKRARLSSAQLTTYYYGFTELLKLRKQAEAKPGFSERAYHDKLLSWGSPGMKYVRKLLAL